MHQLSFALTQVACQRCGQEYQVQDLHICNPRQIRLFKAQQQQNAERLHQKRHGHDRYQA